MVLPDPLFEGHLLNFLMSDETARKQIANRTPRMLGEDFYKICEEIFRRKLTSGFIATTKTVAEEFESRKTATTSAASSPSLHARALEAGHPTTSTEECKVKAADSNENTLLSPTRPIPAPRPAPAAARPAPAPTRPVPATTRPTPAATRKSPEVGKKPAQTKSKSISPEELGNGAMFTLDL